MVTLQSDKASPDLSWNRKAMKTIFDFGMCDAADTVYFLEEGFKVVAVEANAALV